jgi:hypothetical protein
MIQVGLWLLCVGVADALLSFIPEEPPLRRLLIAVISATALAFVGSLAIGFGLAQSAILAALTATTVAGWIVLSEREGSEDSSWLPLLLLGGAFVVLLAVAGVWHPDYTGPVARWYLHGAPGVVRSVSIAGFVMAVGAVVFLQASGNVVVRHILSLSGTPTQKAESQLRGGRIIGGLERTFIFGLAVAGDPTAAAIVVAAKSLLRFPEIRSSGSPTGATGGAAPPTIHEVTEYFLVGSLASWLLALLFVPLVLKS